MLISASFRNWHFDWKSSLITIILLPLVFYFAVIIRKYLRSWGSYLLEGILYNVGRTIQSKIAARMSLRRYCRLQLADDTRYLFVPSTLDIKLDVDSAFVNLTLEQHAGETGTYDHTNLLSLGNRIRVIGDPGSGKSSLVKKLFRDACREALARPARSRLPVLVELKRLAPPENIEREHQGEWLLSFIRTEVSKTNVYRMRDAFEAYTGDHGLLILLDGLDEVSTSQYPRVQAAIDGFSRLLSKLGPSNVVVLTMRTQFHQQVKDDYRDSFGPALFLRPFSPTDIYTFLLGWPFSNSKERNVARIFKELTDRPSLRDMCANPLVLAMYVAEDQARGHVVAPDSRTDFYRKVAEELLIRRRLLQTGPAPASAKLREQRERILGKISYDHLLNYSEPANALLWGSALSVVKDVMLCNDDEAEAHLRELAKETGLITEERARETFRFIHLTFCEFFAAFEAVQGQENGWVSIVAAHRQALEVNAPQARSRLVEVLPFACGLMQRVSKRQAVSDVAGLSDLDLLARTFLETKLYDHEAWRPFIESYKRSLLTVREDCWDEKWLRDLHLVNVVVQDANQCARHMGAAIQIIDLEEFFLALLDNQRRRLAWVLGAYAQQDAAAAFRLSEITQLDLAKDIPEIILTNCDQPPFLALVIEQAARETKRVGLWAPLLAEAMLHSSIVSNALYSTAELPEWRPFVLEVPKRQRWIGSSLIPASLCTQCITVALGPRAYPVSPDSYVSLLGNVPPPNRYVVTQLSGPILVFGLLAFLLVTFGSNQQNLQEITLSTVMRHGFPMPETFFFIMLLGTMLAFTVGYALLFKFVALRVSYRRLLLRREFPTHGRATTRLLVSVLRALSSRLVLGKQFCSAMKPLLDRRS